jgi:hypothetical protein
MTMCAWEFLGKTEMSGWCIATPKGSAQMHHGPDDLFHVFCHVGGGPIQEKDVQDVLEAKLWVESQLGSGQ